jgi:hypothetical protein
MTVEEAKNLFSSHGHALSHLGEIRRVKFNGAVKTWKRDPSRVEVPCKYGMYECFRDFSSNGETLNQLIILLDAEGNPTNDETAATV